MKLFLKILAALAVVLLLACAAVFYVVLTPERITPLVIDAANQYIKADVQCEKIDITLFSSFPNLTVRLNNGRIITKPDSVSPPDTLLSFSALSLAFNPVEYLRNNRIVVDKITLRRATIDARINEAGKPNWDIFISNDTSAFVMPDLDLRVNEISLSEAKIRYSDQQSKLFASLAGVDFSLSGAMYRDTANLALKLDIRQAGLQMNDTVFAREIPIHFAATLGQNLKENRVHITEAQLNLAGVDFNLAGNIRLPDSLRPLNMDISYGAHTSSFHQTLASVPKHLFALPSGFVVDGEIGVSGTLQGEFSPKSYPLLQTDFFIRNARLRYTKLQVDTVSSRFSSRKATGVSELKNIVEKLDIEGNAWVDLSQKQPSRFALKSISLRSPAGKVDGSLAVDDFFKSRRIKTQIKGDINLRNVQRMLALSSTIRMRGTVQVDMQGEFRAEDIINMNYGNINATGEIRIDSVLVRYPEYRLRINAPAFQAHFGSNTQHTNRRGIVRDLLFRGTVQSDTLSVSYEDMQLSASASSMTFSASKTTETSAIVPLSARITLKKTTLSQARTRANRNDTAFRSPYTVRAQRVSGTVHYAGQNLDLSKPEYMFRLSLDTLHVRIPDFSSRVDNGKLTLTVRPRERTGNRARLDSTAVEQRQKKRQQDIESKQIIDMRLQSQDTKDALRQWEFSGIFDICAARLRTPFFPTRMRLEEGSVEFSADSVLLRKLHLKVGNSEIKANGKIEGIRRALLYNSRLSATFDMESEMLDLNQLIQTMAAGSAYVPTVVDTLTLSSLDENEMDLLEPADSLSAMPLGVLVVPRNIDFSLHAKIKKARYAKLDLEDINTNIMVRNQTLQLPQMKLKSNVGDMNFSLAYQAENLSGALLNTTLDLQKIQAKQLMSSFPVIDTLMPMLRSFEGVVSCNLAATVSLDSLMNVDLNTAEASCTISGENLMLLDGETFDKIAKMLFFKSKKQNPIDSLSVEMMMRDGYMYIFPFEMTLDRYKVGIGGTQYLNMDFDYHISVLKSPVPFKFGINIVGNPDKMKYRLVKAKFKDFENPAKKEQVYGKMFNLRKALEDKIRKDIDGIINQPAQQMMPARRTVDVAERDSLRRLFVSDSITVSPADTLDVVLPDSIKTSQTRP